MAREATLFDQAGGSALEGYFLLNAQGENIPTAVDHSSAWMMQLSALARPGRTAKAPAGRRRPSCDVVRALPLL